MLSVAIDTMIDEMRSFVMNTALISPHISPTAAAMANSGIQPSPCLMPSVSATYCATDAVAVNEMSMPPDTSTTSNPEARMPTKALEVSRSYAFCTVRKLLVANESTSERTRITESSQNSWLRTKRLANPLCTPLSAPLCIDHRLQLCL